MQQSNARPYALKAGEGWTYQFGIDFTVKAGELGHGRRVAVLEYTTRRGEEPEEHTHPAEDEIFCVLQGSLTFRCSDETFEVDEGGFVFLPRGIPHSYTIQSEGDVRLLAITAPAPDGSAGGWGGFVADIERDGELRAAPNAAQDR